MSSSTTSYQCTLPPPPQQPQQQRQAIRSSSHHTITPIDTTRQQAYATPQSTAPPPRPSSPKAPAYSPITPKVQPIFPVTHPNNEQPQQPPFMPPPENGGAFTFQPPLPPPPPTPTATLPQQAAIAPTPFIPAPPNQPFSSEDSTDAIALRAAISSLQFQKQKAERDIRTLGQVKEQALQDPERFQRELASGRLKEQRPTVGDLRAILDEVEDGDDEDEVVLGAADDVDDDDDEAQHEQAGETQETREIPDSQPSFSSADDGKMDVDVDGKERQQQQQPFPRIPGPQDVVRMPYINWEKYHIVGEPLEAMHEQQRRWPGSAPFARDKGREHQIAAPYSPFLDTLEPQAVADARKDSAASPGAETRKRH